MINLDNINSILVVGLGYRTGLAASNFLAASGKTVTVNDLRTADELSEVTSRLDRRVSVIAGTQDASVLDKGFDLLVLSPGVPASIPLVKSAVERSIPVISEIELAAAFLKGTVIAITGTDGKSTTTDMTAFILKYLGMKTLMGGNIGIPLISLVEQSEDETFSVIEVSSFQLETVRDFRPDASALLNVTPDHLDRYAGMEDYFQAKMRVAMNQKEGDFFVYNLDDGFARRGSASVQCAALPFSLSDKTASCFFDGESIFLRKDARPEFVIKAADMGLIGLHNVQNAMASLLLVVSVLIKREISPDIEKIAEALKQYRGLPHRMEPVGEYQGRCFVNDSKATTVGAVEMALRSMDGNGVLIVGGRTKGDDYSRLADAAEGRVHSVVTVGESADYFYGIFSGFNREKSSDLRDAVMKAMKMSKPGDTILLSPACASFDMFKSFEERGELFRSVFKELSEGAAAWS